MKQNKLHRNITAVPFAATDNYGEILPLTETLKCLQQEVTLISDAVELFLTPEVKNSIITFIEEREQLGGTKLKNAEVARRVGIEYPDEFFYPGKAGRSRVNKLFGARLVAECLSWDAREKVANGESKQYVSQGWKRTARASKPRNLAPKINLADTDKQYCNIEICDDMLILHIVIQGKWRKLYFNYDERFMRADSVSKPTITVNQKGNLRFSFPLTHSIDLPHFSEKYVIGVDVGITNYATVSVVEVATRKKVFSTTLSQRVHSLSNKVKKANAQVASLRNKGRVDEASFHRAANARRKRELAILAAQEVAHLSVEWGNAIVVVEDLSWVENTMANGRWNRGEFISRLREQVEINGGRVISVNCRDTSRLCSVCGDRVIFDSYHDIHCDSCGGVFDRDENASVNIACRVLGMSSSGGVGIFEKMCRTRNVRENAGVRQVQRSRNGTGRSLKFPGRDRTKRCSTPRRGTQRKRCCGEGVSVSFSVLCSARHIDDVRVALDAGCGSVRDGMTVKGNMLVDVNGCGVSYGRGSLR